MEDENLYPCEVAFLLFVCMQQTPPLPPTAVALTPSGLPPVPLCPRLQTGQLARPPFGDDALDQVREERHDRSQADAELDPSEYARRGVAAPRDCFSDGKGGAEEVVKKRGFSASSYT